MFVRKWITAMIKITNIWRKKRCVITKGEKAEFLIAQIAIDCSGIANDCFECNQLFPPCNFHNWQKVSVTLVIILFDSNFWQPILAPKSMTKSQNVLIFLSLPTWSEFVSLVIRKKSIYSFVSTRKKKRRDYSFRYKCFWL
jgi:hypothetical protein